jgi:hypothetical protein
MQPHNKAGEPADTRSTDVCACFDPGADAWAALPSLPAARSSHDVAVVGDTLVVVGGWTLKGEEQVWQETVLTLDLKTEGATWQAHPQPFRRRALIAAAYEAKVYVLGGFDENEEVVDRVDAFDPATGAWTEGPRLPAKGVAAFGPAACTLQGKLYVSLGDGTVYRMDGEGKEARWTLAGHATPRLVHRMAAWGEDLVVMGGATTGKNLDSIERVRWVAGEQAAEAQVGTGR